MKPSVDQLVRGALARHGESLAEYQCVLPHLSSYFFKAYLLGVLTEMGGGSALPYWTNLESAGNAGAASIFVILDEYTRKHAPAHGDKVMLFIPESGQFNFVLVSLTAIHP